VIASNENRMARGLKVVAPLLEAFYHWKELTIVGVVVLLRGGALSRVEGYWPQSAESIVLVEDSSDRESASIGLERDWLGQIEVLENWRLGESALKLVEG
jgi:hypothetical protein